MKKKLRNKLGAIAAMIPDEEYQVLRKRFLSDAEREELKKMKLKDKVVDITFYQRPVNHLKRLKKRFLNDGWKGVMEYLRMRYPNVARDLKWM